MKKRLNSKLAVLIALLLIVLGACSKSNEESSLSDPKIKEENITETLSSSEKDKSPSSNNSNNKNHQSTSNSNVEEAAEDKKIESDEKIQEPESSAEDFDLENYLNANYIIDGVHYKTTGWGEIGGPNRIDYRVEILPDTNEFSEEISNVFKSGILENEITQEIVNIAETIMDELPEINSDVHIDSVNWVSYDGEFQVMLIQDYENSN